MRRHVVEAHYLQFPFAEPPELKDATNFAYIAETKSKIRTLLVTARGGLPFWLIIGLSKSGTEFKCVPVLKDHAREEFSAVLPEVAAWAAEMKALVTQPD